MISDSSGEKQVFGKLNIKRNLFLLWQSLILFILFMFCGCSVTRRYISFEAQPSAETFTYFSNGIPITSYKSDKEFILFSVQETFLLKKPYLRIWLLYRNISDSLTLVEPFDLIKVNGNINNKKFLFSAQSPTEILQEIDEEKNAMLIIQGIGGALQALTTEATTIKSNVGTEYKINDKSEKQTQIVSNTVDQMSSISNWYNIFKASFNSGVLRKNTVFPNSSVNGYIYFPLNNIRGTEDYRKDASYSISDVQFEVILFPRNKKTIIELKPTNIW